MSILNKVFLSTASVSCLFLFFLAQIEEPITRKNSTYNEPMRPNTTSMKIASVPCQNFNMLSEGFFFGGLQLEIHDMKTPTMNINRNQVLLTLINHTKFSTIVSQCKVGPKLVCHIHSHGLHDSSVTSRVPYYLHTNSCE